MLAAGEGVDLLKYEKSPLKPGTDLPAAREGTAARLRGDVRFGAGAPVFSQGVTFGLIGQYSWTCRRNPSR